MMLHASDIRAAIRAGGDLFLPDFRRRPVPQSMDELQARLVAIEARCLGALQRALGV